MFEEHKNKKQLDDRQSKRVDEVIDCLQQHFFDLNNLKQEIVNRQQKVKEEKDVLDVYNKLTQEILH